MKAIRKADRFKVGDPCFAKVRGFVPYPAKIVEKKATTKVKFNVVFYGTKETADVGLENLWEVNASNIQKFVNTKSMSRKYFQSGYEEMLEYHQLGGPSGDFPDDEAEVAKDTPESDDEFDFEFDYNVSRRKALKKAGQASVPVLVNIDIDSAGEKPDNNAQVEGDEDELFDPERTQADIAVAPAASDAGKIVTIDDIGPEIPVERGATSAEQSAKKKKGQSNPKKRAKGNPTKSNKGVKTLRDAEVELNAAFAEKIEVKDDETFHCRACGGFQTNVRLLARSHAQSCGAKKTAGRRTKRISCTECGESFPGKASLMIHVHAKHTMPSYECSVCFKTFKKRAYYLKHLKIHDERTDIVCPFCPKTFPFESYKLRHIQRAHKSNKPLPIRDCVANKDDDSGSNKSPKTQEFIIGDKDDDNDSTAMVEVNQTEVRCNYAGSYFWQYGATFPAVETSQSRSYESFYSTLGLQSEEDWILWQELSMNFNLPVAIDGSEEGIEVAIAKNVNGDEKIMCIGSNINTVEGFVMVIVCDLIEAAVYWSEEVIEVGSSDEFKMKGNAGVIESILAGEPELAPAEAVNVQVEQEDSTLDDVVADEGFGAPDVDRVAEEAPEAYEVEEEISQADEAPEVQNGDGRKEKESHMCPLCQASGFRSPWFVRRHISLMHSDSIKCKICSIIFSDKFNYIQHAKTCFFWCSKPGCGFHEKRKGRVDSHERSHMRDE